MLVNLTNIRIKLESFIVKSQKLKICIRWLYVGLL